MSVATIPLRYRDSKLAACLVLVGAVLVALVSARDHAGSWNDGSRLATVESLVDQGTWAIDASIFVAVPPRTDPASPGPYPRGDEALARHGTLDKLWIDGHYYSDKSPVPALLMAGLYRGLQWATGLTAREHPDCFCLWMTLATSGAAYVIAVWCIYRLGRPLWLPLPIRVGLTISFALATVALPYARQVNNHIMLLGVVAPLLLGLAWLAEEADRKRITLRRMLGLGTLMGLGYTIDLGVGPVLVLSTLGLAAWRCRQVVPVLALALAAAPWFFLHHGINHAIGGTFKPANAVPEYFLWPGCPFDAANLTGNWKHPTPGHLLAYLATLLVGKNGFLGHNLPLFMALAAGAGLLWRRAPEWPEVLFAAGFCGGVWLLYGVNSSNHSGQCCSIRWFVPFLPVGYYLLGVFLRREPRFVGSFWLLTAWGIGMALLMWREGPWMKRMVPGYWFLQAGALLSVGLWELIWLRQAIPSAARQDSDREGALLPRAAVLATARATDQAA